MSTLRAFIALSPPADWREYFATVQSKSKAELEARLPHTGSRAFRWVATENIHLTLLFLGDVEEKNVSRIAEAMQRAAESTSDFSLSVGNIGYFPERGAPRVFWQGLKEPSALMEFQSRLIRELAPEREVLCPHADARSFQPSYFKAHLTLARIKSADAKISRTLKGAVNAQIDIAPPAPAPWRVEKVELFQSKLTPSGPLYSRLAEARFSS